MRPSWRARGSSGEDQVRRVTGTEGEVLVRVRRRVGGEREGNGWEMVREMGMESWEGILGLVLNGRRKTTIKA